MALVPGPGIGGSHATVDALSGDLGLAVDQHVRYIQSLDSRKDEMDYWLTEHLRLNGVYWGLTALHLLGRPDALPPDMTLQFVLACQNVDGGFGAAPGHDSHMLYTVSAVQILATIRAQSQLDRERKGWREKIATCECLNPLNPLNPSDLDLTFDPRHVSVIASLQNPDTGAFSGDEWGETDTRFLYGALNALSILESMHVINIDKAINHVQSCLNLDGAFGFTPGAESHAGGTFTGLGALSIAHRLDLVDLDRLAAWLSERQLPSGGLNGRPEKLEDVCYSWWVLSSLAMIGRLHWINKEQLTRFILRCQDTDHGGIADRPGDMVDVFHTHFGVAGLSLLGYPGLAEVDPVYCMPKMVTQALASKSEL